MRASRLISLLLLLQTRGQLTAAELAERLEVSERSIQRDADALAAAGVPVEAVRGPAGGYRLAGGYRTRLTGLTAEEAEALFAGPVAELGLGRVFADARLKVLAALPPELQERAERSVRFFHLDTRGWFRGEDKTPHLPTLASAVWQGGLKEGKGSGSTESGVLSNAQYSFSTRFESGLGTNPEELIAAAQAGCFSMALSAELV